MSQSSQCDSLHIVRFNNIPWTATRRDVVDLFTDIKILHGTRGVHFIIDKDSQHNDAFIQLGSKKDYELALNRKGVRMVYSTVNSE